MKNSHASAAMRASAFADINPKRSDDDIAKEITALRAEREKLQADREKKRLRIVELSGRIAALETIGPIRAAQRKLGGLTAGVTKVEIAPAKIGAKGRGGRR